MEKPEIMELVPDFYDAFHCLGKECRYSCCREWPIHIPKKDFKMLRSLSVPSKLRARLNKGLIPEKSGNSNWYAKLGLDEQGGCYLLDKDGLCELQKTMGADALPQVCQSFPRSRSFLYNAAEASLRLSCEAAVGLLLAENNPIRFESRKLQNWDKLWYAYAMDKTEIERNPLLPHCWEMKALFMGILQNRFYTVTQRILYCGVILQALLRLEEQGRTDAATAFLEAEMQRKDSEKMCKTLNSLPKSQGIYFGWLVPLTGIAPIRGNATYQELAARTATFYGIEWGGKTSTADARAYEKAKNAFFDFCTHRPLVMENIAVCLWNQLEIPFGGIYKGDVKGIKRDLWKNYRFFCGQYAILKFVLSAVLAQGEPDDVELARIIAVILRMPPNQGSSVVRFEEEMTPGVDATPLELMSILVKG